MDSATLASVMGHTVSQAKYDQYVGPFNTALIAAGCTTIKRAAMFCAQLGHESLGLLYMQELASGAEYEGRADLGNTVKGDGVRFKGRGPIQLTGRYNYGKFSQWCHDKGLVPTADYFVQNPILVATAQWGFLAASWYWTVARTALNSYADTGNVTAATKAINGGTNGLADRQARYSAALKFGNSLLPTNSEDNELDANQAKQLDTVFHQLTDLLKPWGGGVSDKDTADAAGYNLFQYLLRNNVEIHQLRGQVAALTAKVDALAGT